MENFNFEHLKLSTSDYLVLEKGFKTEVEENGEVVAIHYHFVGSPFSGLWKKKMTKNQIARSEEKRQNSGRIIKKKISKPAMTALKMDDGWNFIMNETANVDDVKFVSENNFNIISVKKIKLKQYIQSRINQERDQISSNSNLTINDTNLNTTIVEVENSFDQAKQENHNREMHSGNGNMMTRQEYSKYCREQYTKAREESGCRITMQSYDEYIKKFTGKGNLQYPITAKKSVSYNEDFISRFNEFCQQKDILEYSETVKVTQYNESPGWFVTVHVIVNNKKFIGNGTALQKKEAKKEACKMLLDAVEKNKLEEQMSKISLTPKDVEKITACDCVNNNIFIPSLLVIGGVEQNPGPQNEYVNGKRDSKTHRHQGIKTRIERLQNSHPEHALKLKERDRKSVV